MWSQPKASTTARGYGTTTQQGYGWAWQQLRLEAFRVYGTNCYLCGQPANTVDHLDALMHTDRTHTPTIDRVRPCCTHCNSSRGAREGNARRRARAGQPPARRTSRRW